MTEVFKLTDIQIPAMNWYGYTNYPERLTYMRTVKIDKQELLTKVKQNRQSHFAMFEAAQKGFCAAAIAALDKMLEDAKAGRTVRREIGLQELINQLSEYDRIIAQLEMSVDTVIELSDEEFANFVMDQWRWSRDVKTCALAYADPSEAVIDQNGLTYTSWRPRT